MSLEVPRPSLKGRKALVVGIANEHSIAYGCAKAFHELEAELAITYLSEKAKPYVQPIAESLRAPHDRRHAVRRRRREHDGFRLWAAVCRRRRTRNASRSTGETGGPASPSARRAPGDDPMRGGGAHNTRPGNRLFSSSWKITANFLKPSFDGCSSLCHEPGCGASVPCALMNTTSLRASDCSSAAN